MLGFRGHAHRVMNRRGFNQPLRARAGFTLVEVLVGLVISVIMGAALFRFGFMIEKAKYENAATIKLTSQAEQLVEQMAVGVRLTAADRKGITEAISATLDSTSQITYLDAAGGTHSFRANGGNIEYRRGTSGSWTTVYDPNGATAFDSSTYSTSLAFSQTNPRAVTVRLVLGQKIKGRWSYGSVSTQIAFRNA